AGHELLGRLYREHLERPADAFAHEGRALSLRNELAGRGASDRSARASERQSLERGGGASERQSVEREGALSPNDHDAPPRTVRSDAPRSARSDALTLHA